MKETLESIRNFHNILILVCAAGFLFSLSVKPKYNPYSITQGALSDFAIATRPLTSVEVRDTLNQVIYTGQQIHERFSSCTIYEIHELFKSRELNEPNPDRKDSLINAAFFKFLISQDTTSTPVTIINSNFIDTLFQANEIAFSTISGESEFSTAWNIVQNETLNEAITKLAPEADAYEKSPEPVASIFSFSVSGKHMPFISPLILFILLIYILSLLKHANTLRSDLDRDQLLSFPWVALFETRLGIFLSATTLFVFPLITAWQVIENSSLGDTEGVISIMLYLVLLSCMAYAMWIQIEKLKDFRNSTTELSDPKASEQRQL